MAGGGLYDHVAGGFFRYATRRDWTVPHYEKMLEDNARLAGLYLEAAVLADGPGALYRAAAEGTIDYLLATLWRAHPPAFGGSQDADEHYYRLDAAGRAELPEPFVDPTVYVDWNALAARALLRAAPALQRPELTERAVELLGFLWEHGRRDAAMAHYLTPAGEPGPGAPLLVDLAGRLRGHRRAAVAGGRAGARRLGRRAPARRRRPPARPPRRARRQRRASGAPAPRARGERTHGRGAPAPRGVHRRGRLARPGARDPYRVGDALRRARRRGGGLRTGAAPLPGTAGPHRRRTEPRRCRGTAPARRRAGRAAAAPHGAAPRPGRRGRRAADGRGGLRAGRGPGSLRVPWSHMPGARHRPRRARPAALLSEIMRECGTTIETDPRRRDDAHALSG